MSWNGSMKRAHKGAMKRAHKGAMKKSKLVNASETQMKRGLVTVPPLSISPEADCLTGRVHRAQQLITG